MKFSKDKLGIYLSWILGIVFCLSIIAIFPVSRFILTHVYEFVFRDDVDDIAFMARFIMPLLKITIISGVAFTGLYFYKKDRDFSVIHPVAFWGFFLLSILNIYTVENFRGINAYCDFGDFINEVENYTNSGVTSTNYPPLAVVIYKIVGYSLGEDLQKAACAKNYWLSLMVVICTLILFIGFRDMLKNRYKTFIALSFFITYPMFFLYGRANLLLLAFAFTVIYLCLNKSEDRLLRYLSFFSLAVAANIKYYPAIFGLILVKEKRIKDAFICAGMGILLFISPILYEKSDLLIRKSGVDVNESAMSRLVKNSIDFSEKEGLYITNSIRDTIFRIFSNSGVTDSKISIIVYIIMVVFVVVSAVSFFVCEKKSDELYILSMICIVVPAISFDYALVFFIVPFCHFINENRKINAVFIVKLILYYYILVEMYKIQFPLRGHMWQMWLLWVITVISSFVNLEGLVDKFIHKLKNLLKRNEKQQEIL